MCHNILADSSQNNFLQQPQQQQQQQQPQYQHQQVPRQQNFNQPMQRSFPGHPMNQQGPFFSAAPCQQDPFSNVQPPQNVPPNPNAFQAAYRTGYDIQAPNPQPNCGSLPSNILDQIRACISPPAPIFILPNNPIPVVQNTQAQPAQCPAMRSPWEASTPSQPFCYPPSCIPYPFPMPIFNPMNFQIPKEEKNCDCCPRKTSDRSKSINYSSMYPIDDSQGHRCERTTDDTVCTKKNCPSSINLQALASQLLAIHGVISCAVTRLVLRKVPGSNVTNSMEETMERAIKSIKVLTQDQLLTESKNCQQINALINLHMTANPPQNVIPTLTTIQLKVNLLKREVECLINRRITENQSVGAEGSGCLDAMSLALKSNEELRTLLATLRQKECDERVNYNFAPYHSQRAIAESRLRNVESKIYQVEREIERRRCAQAPITVKAQDPGYNRGAWHAYPGTALTPSPFERDTRGQCYESPDPFQIDIYSPRRLNLKPHVGSPETSYKQPATVTKDILYHSDPQPSTSDNEDGRHEVGQDTKECHCDEDRSLGDDSADEAKKKLQVKLDKAGRAVVLGRDGIVITFRNRLVDLNENLENMEITDAGINGEHEKYFTEIVEMKQDDKNVTDINATNGLTNKVIFLHKCQSSKSIKYDLVRSKEPKFCGEKIDDIPESIDRKHEFSDEMLGSRNHTNESVTKSIGYISLCDPSENIERSSDEIEKVEREIIQKLHDLGSLGNVSTIPGSLNSHEHEKQKNNVSDVQPAVNHDKNSTESTVNNSLTHAGPSDSSNNEKKKKNVISGGLSVIGNHVDSFASILREIDPLRFSLMAESAPNNDSFNSRARGHCRERKCKNIRQIKEPINWQYMTITKLSNTETESSDKTVQDNHIIGPVADEETAPINRIIVQDRANKRTFVLRKKAANDRQNKMTESSKIQRTLLIRSRLKNSQSTLEEQPIPFSVVTLPKRRQNSIALLSGPSTSNSNNPLDPLKTSEKFWFFSSIEKA